MPAGWGRVWALGTLMALIGLPVGAQAGETVQSALRAGFEDHEIERGDDGSGPLTGLGFTVDLFGRAFSHAYVNNNGNMTFGGRLSTFTPFDLSSTDQVIIAPFFADVDTRGTTNGAQPVRFGQGTVGASRAFGATWRNVGYFNQHTEHLNSFQLVLIDRSDVGPGDFDIEFNYDTITWESGNASGGDADGLGGFSARVGYSKGTGAPGTFLEFAGSGVPGTFLDRSESGALIGDSYGSDGVLGRYVFAVRNGGVSGVDTDGDSLPDEWEENGADLDLDGTVDVDLPAMGADKDHKDIFVEVDWMAPRPPTCIWMFCWAGRTFVPMGTALDDVRAAFTAADVPNPDGVPGIHLHIDAGAGSIMDNGTSAPWGGLSGAGQVPYDANLGSFLPNGNYDWTEFQAVKAANFDADRSAIFHYGVYADRYGTSGSSGISRGIGASDFIVSDGPWTNGFTRIQERGTVMHELGHNLGLRHGGDDHQNYEPNFVSIMNYAFQLDGIVNGQILDYSRAQLATLNEAALSESAGLDGSLPGRGTSFYCPNGAKSNDPAPLTNVDWNCSGGINGGTVSANINKGAGTILDGYDDWANIVFDGGQIGGATGIDAGATNDIEMSKSEAVVNGVAAADGDGAIHVVGPSVLLPNTGMQPIVVKVENLGGTPATYDVGLTTDLPDVDLSATILLAPGASSNVELLANTAGLDPGDYGVAATLSVAEVERATDAAVITVPNLNEPGEQQNLEDALAALSGNTDPSLDPDLYEAFAGMAATELGAPIADFVRPTTERFFVDHPTTLEWTADDPDGFGSFDLQHRIASPSGSFAAWFNELAFSPTAAIAFQFEPGTHCLRVRARDDLDNLGPYTAPHCFGIPLEARSGVESAQWTPRPIDAAYHGRLLQTRADGATIEFTGIRYKRIVLVASRVPGGGRVAVFVGGRREATIDLDGPLARRRLFAIDARGSVSSTKRVRIEVLSSGDLVQIEGLGVSRS